MNSKDFTLLIPTYNRTSQLARLLEYLARQSADFPILVLDSGSDESKRANSSLADRIDLDVRFVSYDSSAMPWEKFWSGCQEVKTEFCSICADDDVVVLDALPPLLEFLRARPDYSAAHGWYFSFYDNVHFGITSIVYSRPSFDQDEPLLRLRETMNGYEAVTYGLYRTDVAREVLREVQRVQSLLGRELLAGALTAVAGKVARLPLLYYGRSLGSSEPYQHWHPVEFMISSPEELVADYGRYRAILLRAFGKYGTDQTTPTELLRLIDLIHLKYLSEYISPEVMNYLVSALMKDVEGGEIMRGYWPRLAAAGSQPSNSRLARLVRAARARVVPGTRMHELVRRVRLAGDRTVSTTTTSGRRREYRLYKEFLASLSQPHAELQANTIDRLVQTLNAYE